MYPKYIFIAVICFNPHSRNSSNDVTNICFDKKIYVTLNLLRAVRMLYAYVCKNDIHKKECTYHLTPGYHFSGILVFENNNGRYKMIKLCHEKFLSVISPHNRMVENEEDLYINESNDDGLIVDMKRRKSFIDNEHNNTKQPELYLSIYLHKKDKYNIFIALEHKSSQLANNYMQFLGGTYEKLKYDKWNYIY